MSTIKLSNFKSGLSKLRKLGHEYDTFEARGITFKLRTITRDELAMCNEQARPLFEAAQEKEDSFSLGEWLNAMRLHTLSHSLMRVDEMDFEGVTSVLDDSDPAKPLHISKVMFVRAMLSEWEDSMIQVLYDKFQELIERAEDNSKEGVVFKNKTNAEVLAELEAKVIAQREEMGLPTNAPIGSGSPSQETQDETKGPDLREIKDSILTPVVQERDGYHYEMPEKEAEEVPEEVTYQPERQEHPADAEDALLQEQERLYQEREARKPLNREAVQVREGSINRNEQAPTQIANAPQHAQGDVLPTHQGRELLSRDTRPQSQEGYAPNPTPKGKGNPNFYSPKRRQ